MHKKHLARASWLEQEQVRKCSKLLLFVQITSTAPARQPIEWKRSVSVRLKVDQIKHVDNFDFVSEKKSLYLTALTRCWQV